MDGNNSSKQRVQVQFGRTAKEYVVSQEHATGPDLALAIEWLEPVSSDVVLDIATGGGHVAKLLAPFVKNVIVTDLTEIMLETAQNHLTESGVKNAQYVLADAEALPFLKSSFDIVTCRIAAHHFPNPKKFIQEVARVLRPNGRFVFIDNVAPDDTALADFINLVETIRDSSHVRCLPVVEWIQLFEEQGLSLVRTTLRKKVHPFSSWVNRMAQTDAHRSAVSQILREAPTDAQSQFDIVKEDGSVTSFSTHQWAALAVKER
ncbi:class I SAM-dependent methyltransferase [Alicyclobacillus sp. SO9]|uniref:class I SAM-dependent methyltransferase n=1 Tax=Alicyclobacillus sp. SO9 TaxID=2665646 RepID=UPI0018E74D1E|nr:class I SAM-dependent methyltransferase [Alicyclobacillus sp. SO9]QQE78305.1 class I SAM-dependent methyltransferase [Alicyclobacillus sp. SO9]